MVMLKCLQTCEYSYAATTRHFPYVSAAGSETLEASTVDLFE